jgi:hypothetical protein
VKKFLFFLPFTLLGQTPITIPIDIIQPGNANCTGMMQHDMLWESVNGTGIVQVGQKISCNIPLGSMDIYIVVIKVFEPLTTAFNGMRVFTININGESKTIDINRLAGPRNVLDISFIVAAEKTLNIVFEASARTAVWSQIAYQRTYHNIAGPFSLVGNIPDRTFLVPVE